MVKISANSLGRFAMQIFNGEKASVENVPLAWAVYCSLAGTTHAWLFTCGCSPSPSPDQAGGGSAGEEGRGEGDGREDAPLRHTEAHAAGFRR